MQTLKPYGHSSLNLAYFLSFWGAQTIQSKIAMLCTLCYPMIVLYQISKELHTRSFTSWVTSSSSTTSFPCNWCENKTGRWFFFVQFGINPCHHTGWDNSMAIYVWMNAWFRLCWRHIVALKLIRISSNVHCYTTRWISQFTRTTRHKSWKQRLTQKKNGIYAEQGTQQWFVIEKVLRTYIYFICHLLLFWFSAYACIRQSHYCLLLVSSDYVPSHYTFLSYINAWSNTNSTVYNSRNGYRLFSLKSN